MNCNKNIKILIPAAGFGTRVGSPPAKELFIREDTKQPMIEWSLGLATQENISATIITRKDKSYLIDYLQNHPNYNSTFDLHLIESSTDWQDTLLQAQDVWGLNNIVLLPDVTWQPIQKLSQLVNSLTHDSTPSISIALHSVSDFEKWGILCEDKNNAYIWCEKPKEIPTNTKMLGAWGIFGFHKNIGFNLLTQLIESQKQKKYFELKEKVNLVHLDYFKDLTR